MAIGSLALLTFSVICQACRTTTSEGQYCNVPVLSSIHLEVQMIEPELKSLRQGLWMRLEAIGWSRSWARGPGLEGLDQET